MSVIELLGVFDSEEEFVESKHTAARVYLKIFDESETEIKLDFARMGPDIVESEPLNEKG